VIVVPRGGKGGLKEYLEHGQKKGRELHRNELDQRIPLAGDLDVFEIATTLAHNSGGRMYDHITLSFDENHVTDEMLQLSVDEFRDHALAAWPESERHRVAFYAEAHRPKILTYINSETGKEVKRLTHIHIGIGRHDTATGEAIEPLGFLGPQTDNLKYIDAWQESFNTRHGFSSPKDNPKITPENAVDVLARYTGSKPDALGTFTEQKADLEVILQKEILVRDITTWKAFGELLAEYGEVSKIRERQFNECYRIKQGDARAMRLKSQFFKRQFIERPIAEKLSIIAEKARVAYLEQMQPRKEPDYVAAVLKEWNMFAARENRFLHTGSPFYRNVYKPADASTRLQILNDLERKNNAITSSVSTQRREKNATASRLPGLQVRNLDGIQARSQSLLRGNTRIHVPDGAEGDRSSVGVRQTDDGRERKHDAAFQAGNRTQGTAVRSSQFGAGQTINASEPSGARHRHVIQPSSVIARIEFDLRDRYQQAQVKERYAEIRKNLDCAKLLSRLSHSHGLNPDLYQVATARDGTPRIRCGSRALSPSDFLMKELGLAWKEAAPILRQAYEIQIGGKITKPPTGNAVPTQLWKDFKAEQQATQPALSQRLKMFDGAAKARSSVLATKLKEEQKAALAGLSGADRKAAQAREKLRAATFKAEFNSLLKEERQALRESIQPAQALAWQLYLQTRAQAGNVEALATLKRLDDTARAMQPVMPGITGTLIIQDEEEEKRRIRARSASLATILKALAQSRTVDKNGDTTYHLNGKAVLRDEGQHLAVLDENSDEAIMAGLLLAREKFGFNLTLTGSAEWKRRLVAVSVAQNIAVHFIDPALESMRQQHVNNKRQAMQAPRTPSPKQQPQQKPDLASEPILNEQAQKQAVRARAAAEATEIPTEQKQVEGVVEATPQPLTAAEWIVTQHKPAIQPHQSGNAAVEYVIAYIGLVDVVIDHGRSVAPYPLPINIVLQVGQKIVIDKLGSIVIPVGRTGLEGGKGRG
jgi:hypothetical protein